tara:strand:+ start:465 stop:671 length:207 start_codon:yes stop_codon:yes gene_type:complete
MEVVLNIIYELTLFLLNSIVFLLLGHWITAKAYNKPTALFKPNTSILKPGNGKLEREHDAVVPEWGDM